MTGDPQRGLVTSGLLPGGPGGVNFMIEQPNRGKRSVALDLAHPDGREALLTLVETADVFLTNYMPPVRRRLRIDTEDIRGRNPDIVIARGFGRRPKGPEAGEGRLRRGLVLGPGRGRHDHARAPGRLAAESAGRPPSAT